MIARRRRLQAERDEARPARVPGTRRQSHGRFCRCYPFVAAGVRRGRCAGLRRFRPSNFGVCWSRARARAWSASGSGTPPRGPSGEGRGGPGPGPPPSDSEGPGDRSERRYSSPGTNINAMTPRKNNNVNNSLPASLSGSGSTRWRATPTRAAIKAGRARAASNTRTQNAIASAAWSRPQSRAPRERAPTQPQSSGMPQNFIRAAGTPPSATAASTRR